MYYLLVVLAFTFTAPLFGMEDPTSQDEKKTTVIVGLDDVLFEPDPAGVSGLGSIAKFIESWSLETGQNKLIEMIKQAPENAGESYKKLAQFDHPAYFRGVELPYLWCLYLAGFFSSKDILKITKKSIQTNAYFFEKGIVNKVADTAFTPELEASVMIQKEEVIKIMQELAEQNTIQLIVLANKRAETIDALKTKFPEAFNIFKTIYTSSVTKKLKPNKDAYEQILQEQNIKPDQCIFIETEQQYIETAEKLGISSIYFDRNNVQTLKTALQEMKLLDE